MAQGKPFGREKAGQHFLLGGINTVKPPDALAENEYTYLQNVRAFREGYAQSRMPLGSVVFTYGDQPHSIRRLNDKTPSGPSGGYTILAGAGTSFYSNATQIVSGMTGNPVSMLPFRPDASVQPWMYVASSAASVNLLNPSFVSPGMFKVRSDGIVYKWGVAEPQVAPNVGTAASVVNGNATLSATQYPWTNVGGANSGYNYGHTSSGDGSSPVIIAGLSAGSTVQTNVVGTATVNGAAHSPGDTVSNSSSYPGYYIYPGSTASSTIVVGTFTDSSGNVVAGTTTAPNPVNIGTGAYNTVPPGATQMQIGINSQANSFSANSGSFAINWTIRTSDIATQVSTLGNVTAYYWGDSPHSGPVGAYIWKNVNDTGSGTPRSASTAAGTVTNNSWDLDSTPQDGTVAMQWNTLNSSGTVTGTIPLFSPALESQGFQDFNACFVGNIFIPNAGTYIFTFANKDQIMVGMSSSATISGARPTGPYGQTLSVISGLPLVYVSAPNGSGPAVTSSVSITFASSGTIQVEIDYDYWSHTGRQLHMTVNGQTIPPVQSSVRTNVSYVYVYRSSATGATSNPSPASTAQSTPVLGNSVTPTYSPDPQVDKVDFYRQDSGLANYTYVMTGPNTNPPTSVTDSATDIQLANNPVLQYDNFEPFPSIDLPRKGVVNVSGSTITWVSGDQFNTRWLPGSIIRIGLPQGAASPLPPQIAYTLYARPLNATTINLPGVENGTNLAYNIDQPLLAAQPLPSIWGPTDNTAYMFGCGDSLRPGTLYFTKGNTPDSAPDTNTIEITSPSEPLINGCIVAGQSLVFSTERAWIGFPTFAAAQASTTGVSGSQFNFQVSIDDRGLYIRSCLCVAGGKTVYFRGRDGIYASVGGNGAQSITDAQLFNIFPHDDRPGSIVTIQGNNIFPPDDTNPEHQRLSFITGYLYYDYLDSSGGGHTLVYDEAAKGWSVDVYNPNAVVHALEEGPGVNNTLVGLADNTLRRLSPSGTETGNTIVATRADNAGDARAKKVIGDIFLRVNSTSATPIVSRLFIDSFATEITAFAPVALLGFGTMESITITPTSQDIYALNTSMMFTWPLGTNNALDIWEPALLSLPEEIVDRATDWDDFGTSGNKFIQGFLLEANTYGSAKSIQAQRSDDLSKFTPNESPVTFTNQSIKPFTFTPPFLAHSVRRVSSDGVHWLAGPTDGWRFDWIWKPYPEATTYWATEGITHGLKGFQHIYQVNLTYVASQPVLLTITCDSGLVVTRSFPATTNGLNPTKTLLKLPSPCKGKVFSYTLSSSAPFYLWRDETEVFIHQWGETIEYHIATPFGGPNANYGGAEV